MTEKIIINGIDVSGCEYYDGSNEYTCTCGESDFNRYKCVRYPNCNYKQLQRKTKELEKVSQAYKNLTNKIEETEVYSDTCDRCTDEILLYPSISGRTDYTDEEVYSIALSNIIAQLSSKTAECERLLKADTEKNDVIIKQFNKLQIATEALKEIDNLYAQGATKINVKRALERIKE